MEILRSIGKFFLETLQGILLVGSVLVVVYIFVLQPYEVVGSSMYPTFENGDFLLSNLLDARFHHLRRGDVIVFQSPVEPDKRYIKRIIATEGETIQIENGGVYINGQFLDESGYLNKEVMTYGGKTIAEGQTFTVPVDTYFVEGDNRPNSSDSRDWGFLRKDAVIGRSFLRVWPLTKIGFVVNPYTKSN